MLASNPENSVIIRIVQAQDWPVVREVILKMLVDAPHAYGETLAESIALTPP